MFNILYKRKYSKVLVMILLCIIIVSVSFFTSYQDAKAFVLVDDAAVALLICATLLIASGVILSDPTVWKGFDQAYGALYNESVTLRTWIQNQGQKAITALNTAIAVYKAAKQKVDALAAITNAMDLKTSLNFLTEVYHSTDPTTAAVNYGSNIDYTDVYLDSNLVNYSATNLQRTIDTTDTYQKWTTYPSTPDTASTTSYPFQAISKDTYGNTYLTVSTKQLYWNAGALYQRSGAHGRSYKYISNAWSVIFGDTTEPGIGTADYVVQANYDVLSSNLVSIYFNKTTATTIGTAGAIKTVPKSIVVPIIQVPTSGDAVRDPSVIINNCIGNITPTVSSGAPTYDLTSSDPIPQTNADTSTATYPTHWTGTFKDCYPTCSNYTFDPAGVIDYTNTGVWDGTWGWTATGEKTFTGTLTGDVAWSGTATATADIATTNDVPFDYPKYIPPSGLSTKFPFSIPWDLTNAISSLVATPQAPVWTISFPKNLFVGGGEIVLDMSKFEVWAAIIRWGVLIVFNIFLILATRKLIGAGGGG
jgi:hypothetical protein